MDRHRDLLAWQRARSLALECYRVTRGFPPDERFGMVTQIRRAACSVGANIAEGKARPGAKEYRRFVAIALGSLGELAHFLDLAHALGFVARPDFERLELLRSETSKLTWLLYRSLGGGAA